MQGEREGERKQGRIQSALLRQDGESRSVRRASSLFSLSETQIFGVVAIQDSGSQLRRRCGFGLGGGWEG